MTNPMPSSNVLSACSPSDFMNWDEKYIKSSTDQSTVFLSLVTIIQNDHSFSDALQEKADIFFRHLRTFSRNECESFVLALAPSSPHEAFQTFVTTITILLSTDNTTIVETTLYTINHLVPMCSRNIQFGLLNADLVPQLILSLQPLTRSFKYPQNIHSDLLSIIGRLLWLPTPSNGAYAEIDDPTEQQAVHETILKHVLLPSKDYIRQICSARDLFVDRVFLPDFMTCVAQIILICPFYQPTMDYVLDLPLIFTMITSNDFYDNEESRGCFLGELADAQEEWDKHDKELRRIGTIMNRLLRMEGSEDQIEQMLQSVRNQPREGYIVSYSTRLNNLYGMNIPPRG